MNDSNPAIRDTVNESRRKLLKYVGFGIGGGALAGTQSRSARAQVDRRAAYQNEDFELGDGPPVTVEPVASGLTSPVQFEDPGTEHQYVADQTGQIYILESNGLTDDPFLDISHRTVTVGENVPEYVTYDERGLLGLAFHPDYPDDPRFYARYSAPFATSIENSHTEILAEYTARDERNADPDSERILLVIPQPGAIHQAGTITFGPEGYLYVGTGDGGWPEAGQFIETNLLGGILRIDVDGGSGDDLYGIPEDNPLVDAPGRPEYFAWGFRNPWRMSFYDGDLLVADVGEARYEEINLVSKGGNYGWPIKEGIYCFDTDSTENCREQSDIDATAGDSAPLVDPVAQFPHATDDTVIGRAAVGGYVYDRDEIPDLQGMYVFGNYTSGYERAVSSIFAAPVAADDDLWPISRLPIANVSGDKLNRNILSFGQDSAGRLYLLTTRTPLSEDPFTRDDGEVFRLIAPGGT